jgi:hypothetical protein
MKNKSSFFLMHEPDRMVFIAQLYHYMWYDESCFKEVTKLLSQWKAKENVPPANLFPKSQTETNEHQD